MRTTEASELEPTAFCFSCNRSLRFTSLAFGVVTLSLIALYRLIQAKLGRSWISFPNPTGEPAVHAELVREIVGLSREHGGDTVFRQVAARKLFRYVDLGLMAFKLGEEPIVYRSAYDIKGSMRGNLRDGIRPLPALANVIFVICGGLRGVVA